MLLEKIWGNKRTPWELQPSLLSISTRQWRPRNPHIINYCWIKSLKHQRIQFRNWHATGGVPSARLSIYKACWFSDCEDADLLAAIDDAIHDGVDIISISLGPLPPQPIYFEDAFSIGTLHAFQKGVVVCASAGNSFFPRTTTNVPPWILSVSASTIDREFPLYILLGNLKQLKGFGVNTKPDQGKQYSLISGSVSAAPRIPLRNARYILLTKFAIVTSNKTLVKPKRHIFD